RGPQPVRPVPLTAGNGIEWSPTPLGNGLAIVCLSADPKRPPLPAAVSIQGGGLTPIALNHVPQEFPTSGLVSPEPVSFRAADGVEVHGQLFQPMGGDSKRPAIVYIHGGGPRQMLLAWHTRWEYANDY